jgi:hypothetical protein
VAIPLMVDRAGCRRMLLALAASNLEGSSSLYARLTRAWGNYPNRERITFILRPDDRKLLRRLEKKSHTRDLGVVHWGWLVTYRHPRREHLEVLVFTSTLPPKKRKFKVGGAQRRLVAVEVSKVPYKEAVMATKSRSKKAAEVDELDELDELEALEDEDLEDEPEDEEEEDEEEEEPAPKRRSRAKKAAAKPKRSRRQVVEEEDDEDDEEEDDEDDEPAPKRKRGAKATSAKSSRGTKKATSTKTKATSNGGPRPLASGRLSPADVAEELGVDARQVRIFLRNHADDFPKPDGEFRHSFNKKEAARLIKAYKRGD